MDRPYISTEKPAIVLELGAALLKAGFAGESGPRYILESEIGSFEAQRPPPRLEDWDAFLTPVFVQLFSRYLLVKPKERRVLVLENLFSQSSFRQAVARILLDKFKAPSLSFLPYSTAALAATGGSDGLMVDWGWKETRICPIVQGRVLLKAYQGACRRRRSISTSYQYFPKACFNLSHLAVCPLGAFSMVQSIQTNLVDSSPPGVEMQEQEIVTRELAEDILVRGTDFFQANQGESASFPAAGLRTVTVPRELHKATLTVCFNGDSPEDSVAAAALEALLQTPVDARVGLAERIVCFGGGAMLRGMEQRLLQGMVDLLSSHPRYTNLRPLSSRLRIIPLPFAPNLLSWAGGSVLASLDILPLNSVTGSQYVERNGFFHDWLEVQEPVTGGDEGQKAEESSASLDLQRWTKFRSAQRSATGEREGIYSLYGLPSFEK